MEVNINFGGLNSERLLFCLSSDTVHLLDRQSRQALGCPSSPSFAVARYEERASRLGVITKDEKTEG